MTDTCGIEPLVGTLLKVTVSGSVCVDGNRLVSPVSQATSVVSDLRLEFRP